MILPFAGTNIIYDALQPALDNSTPKFHVKWYIEDWKHQPFSTTKKLEAADLLTSETV
jgi:hypothetical protein